MQQNKPTLSSVVHWTLELCVGYALAVFAVFATAADQEPVTATSLGGLDGEQEKVLVGDHLGLMWQSRDGNFLINPWLRLQTRYSSPFDSDPLAQEDYQNTSGNELEIRRARIKIEGHVFDPAIGFYFEQELTDDHPLLDLRLDLKIRDDLAMRIGQYKVLYNRERVDSSGKQQFIERSISTYAFTLDRQRGISIAKHWAAGSSWDNWLMLAAFEGDGRDSKKPKGDDPMLVARWHWQFLGEPLAFAQSDLKFTKKPAASFALGHAQVQGPYTRYSSSGGGQLDGFPAGGNDRYEMKQWLAEFAFKYQGYSIQQEYHSKDIDDHEGAEDGTLSGGYLQFGKAFHVANFDFPLEIAARYAKVDWDTNQSRKQQEVSLCFNLFFSGHNNKLSFDASSVSLEMNGVSSNDVRVRAQWDVSF